MQRGSDRLSVHKDEEMKHELQGLIRSGRPTRSEEWHDPEPAADDDPVVAGGLADVGGDEVEILRFELARHLGRKAFPAGKNQLLRKLDREHAPGPLIDRVRSLPAGTTFHTVHEVAVALTGAER